MKRSEISVNNTKDFFSKVEFLRNEVYPISGKEPTDPKMSSDWSHISASMRETKKNIIDPKAAQNFLEA